VQLSSILLAVGAAEEDDCKSSIHGVLPLRDDPLVQTLRGGQFQHQR
jgi:hypothetical protein